MTDSEYQLNITTKSTKIDVNLRWVSFPAQGEYFAAQCGYCSSPLSGRAEDFAKVTIDHSKTCAPTPARSWVESAKAERWVRAWLLIVAVILTILAVADVTS